MRTSFHVSSVSSSTFVSAHDAHSDSSDSDSNSLDGDSIVVDVEVWSGTGEIARRNWIFGVTGAAFPELVTKESLKSKQSGRKLMLPEATGKNNANA